MATAAHESGDNTSTALDLGKLNAMYQESDAVDKEIFSEMRSNILLISGEHYARAGGSAGIQRQARESSLNDAQKLRLTKNHIAKIHRRFTQATLSYASGVTIAPAMDSDNSSVKSAEMNSSVWEDAKYRYKLRSQIRKWASDFDGVGEVAVKIFWDPNDGELLGYAHAQDPTSHDGFAYEDDGTPVADTKQPVFRGKMCFERLFAFNLLRDPGAKDMQDSPYIIIRKMVKTSWLRAKYKNDAEKHKAIVSDSSDEFIVFDATRVGYEKSKNQTLIRECYWKPCQEYPDGWFAIWTKSAVLEQGPLPYRVFPIAWGGFEEFASTPRGRSWIKQARPYQAEINRASSQQALAQITISDDKVLYQAGSQLKPGALLPGVRGIAYQGKEPTILAGRDGSQYLNYILAQIDELYKALDVDDIGIENSEGQIDPNALLFRAARQKERFSLYSEKFEEFLVEVVQIFLELAKKYYPDDMLIPAVGTKEFVNIAEFRSTKPLSYMIHVEAQDDTIETRFGKQITMQHLIQYSGQQLTREDLGKVIRNMPFANAEEAFSDLTIDYDNAKNLILALDRGEWVEPSQDDDHVYMTKKLSHRMRQSDFRFLNPYVQQLYGHAKEAHMQMQAVIEQKVIDAKNEFIPVDGPMIACDLYVENDADPSKAPKRARIPQRALDWLMEHMKAQGADLQKLESLNQGTLAEMAQFMTNRGNPPPQPGQARPPSLGRAG